MPDVDNLAVVRLHEIAMVLHVRDTGSGHVIDATEFERFPESVVQIKRITLSESLLQGELHGMIVAHARVFLVGNAARGRIRAIARSKVHLVQPVKRESLDSVIAHVADRSYQVARELSLVVQAPLNAVGGALERIKKIARRQAGKSFQIQAGYVYRISKIREIAV